jgi:hypothetical protein
VTFSCGDISREKHSTLTLTQSMIWKKKYSKRHFQSSQKFSNLYYEISSFNFDTLSHGEDTSNMFHIKDYIFYVYSHFKCNSNEVCTNCFHFMTKWNGTMNKIPYCTICKDKNFWAVMAREGPAFKDTTAQVQSLHAYRTNYMAQKWCIFFSG